MPSCHRDQLLPCCHPVLMSRGAADHQRTGRTCGGDGGQERADVAQRRGLLSGQPRRLGNVGHLRACNCTSVGACITAHPAGCVQWATARQLPCTLVSTSRCSHACMSGACCPHLWTAQHSQQQASLGALRQARPGSSGRSCGCSLQLAWSGLGSTAALSQASHPA